MKTTLELNVSYSQIAIFDPEMANPFSNWLPAHVTQGFVWREGTVSFKTLEEDGDLSVTVVRAANVEIVEDSIRAIAVPFTVSPHGDVEVASIADSHRVRLGGGTYRLICEMGTAMPTRWCRLTFQPSLRESISAEILSADAGIAPVYPLLMTGKPA